MDITLTYIHVIYLILNFETFNIFCSLFEDYSRHVILKDPDNTTR